MRAHIIAATLAATAALAPGRAAACASCGCGDSTLTAMGLEKPYPNRVRLSLEERFNGHTAGDDGVWTLRSALAVSWSPTARVTLALMMPLVTEWPRVNGSGSGAGATTGLGDGEFWARVVVWRDRAFSPRHVLSLLGGLKAPTGPRLYDGSGYPLPDDDQPGTGSWDPQAGASYAWYGERVSLFSSVSYRYGTPGRRGYQRGQALGASAGAQYQPIDRVALSAAAEVGWSAADRMDSGIAVPDSGGTIVAVTPAVAVAPTSNWLIRAGVQIHLFDRLNGNQTDSPAVFLSTVVDLN
jgi:hypothetical protein